MNLVPIMKRRLLLSLTTSALLVSGAVFLPVVNASHAGNKMPVQSVQPLAEQGDSKAQVILGLMYASGRGGVSKNPAEAAKWYLKAAEQGEPVAQATLGTMYRNGIGVTQNFAEAIKWLEKAAEQGETNSQAALGTMYLQGKEVPYDDEKALRWNRVAAEQGDPNAQAALSAMYFGGRGVTQDYAEAYFWANLAASQDRGYAEYRDAIAEEISQEILHSTQKRAREWQVNKK